MSLMSHRPPSRRDRALGRDGGIGETTERIRQLVDGIERTVSAGDDFDLAKYLAPPALGHVLAAASAIRSQGGAWLPARSGLRWSRSGREPGAPGRFWLRLRFEDRTEVQSQGGKASAPAVSHEVEVEVDTTQAPWRLCQAEEIFPE